MLDWATKRKLQYFGIIVATAIIFVVIPFYVFIYEAPTCFDGFKNGDEKGVDCGGSCRLLCSIEISKPISRWDPRVFRVSLGVYNAIAYLENPNVTGKVNVAPYVFRFYDKDNILITERSGKTFIPTGSVFGVFEGRIETRDRIPVRATFEFTSDLIWERDTTPRPNISVVNKALVNEESSPRVEATVKNNSLSRVNNLELVVIIFDGSGNAIAVSRTFVDSIERGETKPVVFTWPIPFETRSEVCASPVDVALVLDRSGSMEFLGKSPPEPLTSVKNAAITFVNELSDKDQAAVISFATQASMPIDSSLTLSQSVVKDAIDSISIKADSLQNTNIGDGILKAREELSSVRKRASAGSVMILLTDGVATHPEKAGDKLYPDTYAFLQSSEAKTAGIQIFTIGLGKDVNTASLQNLASARDAYYSAPSASDLSGIYKQIATKICNKRPAVIEILYRIYPPSYIVQ